MPAPDAATTQRQTLAALDVKRESLELEAEAIVSELTTPPEAGGAPMGIDTPLTDSDGYPRADIDVYRARALRQRLSVIRTDHKDLMQQVDAGLKQLAAIQQNSSSEEEEKEELEQRRKAKPKPKFDPVSKKWVVMNWDGTVAGVAGGDKRSFETVEQDVAASVDDAIMTDSSRSMLRPFAIVDAVAPHSPAADAKLLEGDLIVEFGSVNHTNHRGLLAIGELVPQAAGNQSSIDIVLMRDETEVKVLLRPRPWNGRGLLGCHVKLYDASE